MIEFLGSVIVALFVVFFGLLAIAGLAILLVIVVGVPLALLIRALRGPPLD